MNNNYRIEAVIIMEERSLMVAKNINRKTKSMIRAIGTAVREWEVEFPKPAKVAVLKAELID